MTRIKNIEEDKTMDEQERMDLFDGDRSPLGRTASRGALLAEGEYIVAVGMWIVNSKREILLTKRSAEKRYMPGKWENPSGHVLAGETSERAVIRELEEETGINVCLADMRFLGTAKVGHYFGDNYCVYKDVELNDVRLQPGETCDAKWVTLEELKRMAHDGELSAAVWEHMAAYRDAFYRAVSR